MNALLICNPKDTYWLERLYLALGKLVMLIPITAKESIGYINNHHYDLIFIDEAGVEDVSTLIRRVKEVSPTSRIVVAAEVPTWQEARSAFQAGAVDFIRASMSSEELGNTIKDVVSIGHKS